MAWERLQEHVLSIQPFWTHSDFSLLDQGSKALEICPECGAKLLDPRALAAHLAVGHVHPVPRLYLAGQEIGDSGIETVTYRTTERDWQFIAARGVRIDGSDYALGEAGRVLASKKADSLEIELLGEKIERRLRVQFMVASQDDLNRIDNIFREIAWDKEISISSVKQFRDAARKSTAGNYAKGLQKYLEARISNSANEMNELMNEAQHELQGLDRPYAQVIRALDSFNRNTFDVGKNFNFAWDVSNISIRFLNVLGGRSSESDLKPIKLDGAFVLASPESRKLMAICALPLLDIPKVDSLEYWMDSKNVLEMSKVTILAAQAHVIRQEFREAARLATHLVRAGVYSEWGNRLLERIEVPNIDQ